MNMYNPYSYELYHHGILGQKWGVRKYQYEDGSLTPEGRKRYGLGDRIRDFKEKRKEKYVSKKMESGMSREESEEAYEKHKKAVKTTLLVVGGITIAAAVGYAAYKSGQKTTEDMINDDLGRIDIVNTKTGKPVSKEKADEIENKLSQSLKGSVADRTTTIGNIHDKISPQNTLNANIKGVKSTAPNTQDELRRIRAEAYNAGRTHQKIIRNVSRAGSTYGDSLRNTTKSLASDKANLASQAEELRRRNEMLKRSLGK